MVHVTEYNCLEDLASSHLLWRSLWQQTRNANFFHSLEWLRTYCEHDGRDQHLRVLIVSSGKETLGILPLMILRKRTRWADLAVLSYPLPAWCPGYGPIGPNPSATLLAGMRYLAAGPRDWDLLDLRCVDRQTDHGRTELAMQLAGLGGPSQHWRSKALIDLGRSASGHLSERGRAVRKALGGSETTSRVRGHLQFERHRPRGLRHNDGEPRWDLLDACWHIADKDRASQSATRPLDAGHKNWFGAAHATAAHAGAVDMNLLRLDGRPIAFAYNYFCDGVVSSLQWGSDPEFSPLLPAHLLMIRMLADSCRRGDRLVDLGPGSWRTHQLWATRAVSLTRCRHFSSSPAARWLRLREWLPSRNELANNAL